MPKGCWHMQWRHGADQRRHYRKGGSAPRAGTEVAEDLLGRGGGGSRTLSFLTITTAATVRSRNGVKENQKKRQEPWKGPENL